MRQKAGEEPGNEATWHYMQYTCINSVCTINLICKQRRYRSTMTNLGRMSSIKMYCTILNAILDWLSDSGKLLLTLITANDCGQRFISVNMATATVHFMVISASLPIAWNNNQMKIASLSIVSVHNLAELQEKQCCTYKQLLNWVHVSPVLALMQWKNLASYLPPCGFHISMMHTSRYFPFSSLMSSCSSLWWARVCPEKAVGAS